MLRPSHQQIERLSEDSSYAPGFSRRPFRKPLFTESLIIPCLRNLRPVPCEPSVPLYFFLGDAPIKFKTCLNFRSQPISRSSCARKSAALLIGLSQPLGVLFRTLAPSPRPDRRASGELVRLLQHSWHGHQQGFSAYWPARSHT